jgi:NADH:ubiquinone oxidoreductase subunit 5 (subunit L)/multisubunit Na+/H+ antiporter MnhA subunit
VAIVGLPPLGNFASEFLLYLGAFRGLLGPLPALAPLAVIAALALIGGLAAACFAKAAGVAFLGEPRQGIEPHGRLGPLTAGPLLALALGCVALGAGSPWVAQALAPAVAVVSGLPPAEVEERFGAACEPLYGVVGVGGVLAGLVAALALLRWRLLAGREVGSAGTWDCGYARPTARMQYTGSSFAQPLLDLFAPALRLRRRRPRLTAYFPPPSPAGAEDVETQTADVTGAFYRPAYQGLSWLLAQLRWLQSGRVQIYVLYIVLTLLVLLVGFLGA